MNMNEFYGRGWQNLPPGLGQDLLSDESMEKMNRELTPDPVTEQVEMPAIERYVMSNMNNPDVQRLLNRVKDVVTEHAHTNVSEYNFASLTPEKDAVWHFTLISGRALVCTGSWGEPRNMQGIGGMPDPPTVLQFVKNAIANCPLSSAPSLPEVMLFSPEYTPYVSILHPFLDSLPSPFTWTIETPDLRALRSAAETLSDEFRGAKFLDLAEQCKSAGNFAYSKKNRAGAVRAFSRGVEHATSALEEVDASSGQQVAARRMLAVCLANRAGAHLLDGPGMNAKEALSDAEKAEAADPTYVKGYHRQARAHEYLGEVGKAREVIARAMQKPGMESEQSLRKQLHRLEAF